MNDLDRDASTELCTTTTPPAPTLPDRAPGMHWSWRTDKRVLWTGYHTPELAGVIVPAALVVIWDWPAPFLAVSGGVAAVWGWVEFRRTRRLDKSGSARPAALTPDRATGTQTATGTSDEEATRGHLA